MNVNQEKNLHFTYTHTRTRDEICNLFFAENINILALNQSINQSIEVSQLTRKDVRSGRKIY